MRPLALAPFTLIALAVACTDPCDCPLGQTCTDEGVCLPSCVGPEDCPTPVCSDDDPCCSTTPACTNGQCGATPVPQSMCGPPPAMPDGWDAPPGTGRVYVVSRFALAAEPLVDVDGRCRDDGCAENRFGRFGPLLNDQIRQTMLGGKALIALEIAGLDADYAGFDNSVTVKLYTVVDADDPYFPANNFETPEGQTTCCEFLLRAESLSGGQARHRLPAQIRRDRLVTLPVESTSVEIDWGGLPLDTDDGLWPARPMAFARPQMQLNLPDLDRIEDGVFSGMIPPAWLATTRNPFCRVPTPNCPAAFPESASLLELATTLLGGPDVDLDGDGLDCYGDQDGDGALDVCCPRHDQPVCGMGDCVSPVGPTDPARPFSCAENELMRDGYSASFTLTGVPARIVGVAP